MPFTLYHAGPSALIALPLRKYIDVPVFILANVFIDLEVLIILITGAEVYADSGLHPIAHTFFFGSMFAIAWGFLSILLLKNFNLRLMTEFRLDYQTNAVKIFVSAVLGVWFHIFVDCFYHADLHPLYPFSMTNPLNFGTSPNLVMNVCRILFIPAVILFFAIVIRRDRKIKREGA